MVCGVDEAGRGPVIGPLVVAGVCADEDFLRSIGIRDSKKLSPKRREYLANIIKERADKVEILILEPEDIDAMRENMTLNEIEVVLFAKVIEKLGCDKVYVDAADVDEERFAQEIKSRLSRDVEIVSKHKADDIYPIVSAASIIAKVERDSLIAEIAEEIGDFGSGYPADPRTVEFLEKYYSEHGELPPHTRHSWKSAKRLVKKKQQRTLDTF